MATTTTCRAPSDSGTADAELRLGEEIDPAAVVEKLAAAQVARDAQAPTVALLESLPSRYQDDVVRMVGENKGLFWDDLGEALDDLLGRAEPVVSASGGINSADEALDADKGKEWTKVRALTREYAAIRTSHRALLSAEDRFRNFGSNAPLLGWDMFRGLGSLRTSTRLPEARSLT